LPAANFGRAFWYIHTMRLLCVGRHRFLSEHLCRTFEAFGVAATPCVGTAQAVQLSAEHAPDAVICEYELLATMPIGEWENDPVLSRTPVIAVSLTHSPGEAHLRDVNGIAGFLYLPTLRSEDAYRVLAAACARASRPVPVPDGALSWSVRRSTTPLT
jgi:hypothetical protein